MWDDVVCWQQPDASSSAGWLAGCGWLGAGSGHLGCCVLWCAGRACTAPIARPPPANPLLPLLPPPPQAMADLDWQPEFGLLDGLKDSYSKDFGRGTFRKEADFTTGAPPPLAAAG